MKKYLNKLIILTFKDVQNPVGYLILIIVFITLVAYKIFYG
jgi:hypothetical protein